MRKQFIFLFLSLNIGVTVSAQTKGNKVGYIDMEYILENVPNYTEAKILLEQKADKWKQEIEIKKIEIKKLNEVLKAEKPLLTNILIEERESEIKFLENELVNYQQKRFGAKGDLVTQKSGLAKPIQDQIFTAVQDIAVSKKYDFIFDKSSNLTILFASKRFDISDQVLKVLNRTEKREELTKKELAAQELQESKEDAIDENPDLAEREKKLEKNKANREKIIADRKLAREMAKKEYDEKRKQFQADREAKKNGTVSDFKKNNEPTTVETKSASVSADSTKAKIKSMATEERAKMLEERKKVLEEKRKKILDEREAIKKAAAEKRKQTLEESKASKKTP